MDYFIIKLLGRKVSLYHLLKSRTILKLAVATKGLTTKVTEELQDSNYIQQALIAPAVILISTLCVRTSLL